ncbi:MAG: AAA family ATPase [Bdellovibrionales bacterium]|nr:AAA family ATPase [Bdellovibrionales bacterium]
MAQLSQCQFNALKSLHSDRNVFLTGAAGTGKSFLIGQFMEQLNRKTWPVLASTGAAAIRVGGRTFHSFFGLGIMEGGKERTLERALRDSRIPRRMKKAKGIIIDEISMIPGDALSVAEEIARWSRESEEPWGGLRVIAVGDFFQLPPVSRNGNPEWAFADRTWAMSQFDAQVMSTVVRTNDKRFLDVLNRIRLGILDSVVEEFLRERQQDFSDDTDIMRLFARRLETEKYNLFRLDEIAGTPTQLATVYGGDKRGVEVLKKQAPIPENLIVKTGAFVMIRQNDPRERWVNGSLGHLTRIYDDRVEIELLSGNTVEVPKTSFEIFDAEGRSIAAATNFPINLAYASTIHKSQGATFDAAQIELKGLWEPGQAYVALSRLRSGEGAFVSSWDRSSFRVDPRVLKFYESLEIPTESEIKLTLT